MKIIYIITCEKMNIGKIYIYVKICISTQMHIYAFYIYVCINICIYIHIEREIDKYIYVHASFHSPDFLNPYVFVNKLFFIYINICI
jgi:hypothetical protein